tara:strand:- start:346 stop:828 length:483 start_codon:yes stop_codon:yes gene_type:complete
MTVTERLDVSRREYGRVLDAWAQMKVLFTGVTQADMREIMRTGQVEPRFWYTGRRVFEQTPSSPFPPFFHDTGDNTDKNMYRLHALLVRHDALLEHDCGMTPWKLVTNERNQGRGWQTLSIPLDHVAAYATASPIHSPGVGQARPLAERELFQHLHTPLF